MVRNETSQVNVKFPEKLIERIDNDIKNTGEFRNRSEWIIAAARYYDDYRTKLMAERRLAESLNQNQNESELGSVDQRASTADHVKL